MDMIEYIKAVTDKIDEEIKANNHAEVYRLVTVLRDTLNKKLAEWEKIL